MNKVCYYLLLIILSFFVYSLSFTIFFYLFKGPGCNSDNDD